MASTRGLVATLAKAVLCGSAAGALLISSTTAYAAPTPAEVEAEIDAEWEKLEPIIEQYNAVHGELKASQAKVAELQQKIEPLQLQVDLALERVSEIAVRAYMGGSTSRLNAILTGGSPATLANSLTMLNQLARADQSQIRAVTDLRDRYSTDRSSVDDLVQRLAKQDADLAAKKQEIEKRIADLQKRRQQAYGSARAAEAASGPLKPKPSTKCPVEAGAGAAGTAAAKACEQIGKLYVWGAEGPNTFDCSGLTMYAWKAAGRSLPHNAKAQYNSMPHVTRAQLRTGDLVFSYSDLHHVGIYVGGGYMVHAPRTGDRVKMSPIVRPGIPQFFGRPG